MIKTFIFTDSFIDFKTKQLLDSNLVTVDVCRTASERLLQMLAS